MAKNSQWYRNVRESGDVLGHPPGARFQADLHPVKERQLIVGGHIVKSRAPRKKKPSKKKGGS